MSPLTYVEQCHTPVLILHGMADEACRIDQVRQLYLGLWETGCEVEMVLFPELRMTDREWGPPPSGCAGWSGFTLGFRTT